MGYSVGQVSAFAGVTVRRLHMATEDGAGRALKAVQRSIGA
ncbi:hypothetical protein [Streptomyces graminofaciens]|nr:hypothetical protein [Streptomyces graminofaciens]